MMWAHSKYYGLNNRMITLFKMINNLMIESVSRYLDPSSLFQGEPDESLTNINKVIKILEDHKKCFKEYRERLPEFAARLSPEKDPILWTFRPNEIFERFDHFMNRLYTIRDIFDTANEFFKLEKFELGGLKGRNLSRSVQEIFEKFKNVYFSWSQIQFDPLDPSPNLKHFEKQRKKFQAESEAYENKLAAIVVQAFDECYTIESLIKLIEVCGSLLQRPIVYKEIKDKLDNMLDLYNYDLSKVKDIFDNGVDAMNANGLTGLKVDRSFPPVTGALTWIKKMKHRVVKPTEELPNIEFKDVIFDTEEGRFTMDKVQEMCKLLDELDVYIFSKWCERVPREIDENMQKYLLKYIDGGLLELNFDQALVTALKEVKMLRAMKKDNIPDVALELFENSNKLWVRKMVYWILSCRVLGSPDENTVHN